jgi:uncharacterized cupredoxin-like copper-binding protein
MNLWVHRPVAVVAWLLLTLSVTGCAAATTTPAPVGVSTPGTPILATLAPTRVNTPVVATATAQSIATAPPLFATPTAVPAATTTQSVALDFSFDKDAVGALPSGAVAFSGTWAVRAEADAPSAPNALCQTGTATFPALSLTEQKFADVSVSVRFKPISGNTDRAAGIIFRIQDKDNYYIMRANALEDNVNFYKYVNGQRIDIKDGSGKVASGKWQELRVEVAGNRMRGFLEGQPVVETTDDTYQTGGVGLWTKADSLTCFDNVRIEASPAPVSVQPQPAATSNSAAAGTTPTAAPIPVVSVPPDPASPRGTMQLASFSFSPNTVAARVGQPVRLTLQNDDNIFHEFSLDNSEIDVQVAPGTVQKVDLVFSKPGTYVFACNLTEEGNHRGSGMVGKIVVEQP